MQRPTTDTQTSGIPLQEKSHHGEIERSQIELAMERSPTGGNSKPFYWFWEGRVLHVRHDEALAAHYLNRRQHTSLIALGCLITSVQIGAQHQGFKADCKISETDLSAQITFKKETPEKINASDMQALLNRHTFRGEFAPSDAPVIASETHPSGIQLRIAPSSNISKKMRAFLTKADSYLWRQNKATRAFFEEIRFTQSPQGKFDRGIRVIDLGINKMDQLMLRVLRWMPAVASFMARIPGLNISFRAASLRSQKNSHYVLISATDLSPSGLIHAGQKAMKVWIDLEKHGFKVQPISLASITLVDAALGALPSDTRKNFRLLFTELGPDALRNQFQLKNNEKPVWLLRVGRAKS